MAYIPGTSGRDDLYSGGNADHLAGLAGNDTLYGQGGADTLDGGKGNDTLYGGADDDLFLFGPGEGKDVIADYEEIDKIKFTSGDISVSISGNDYVFTVSKNGQTGTVTVKNAYKNGQLVTYIDGDGVVHEYPKKEIWNDNFTSVTLTGLYDDTTFDVTTRVNGGKTDKIIDASAVTHDINIIANSNANSIKGSEENDSIDGGAGKDTILGGDGNDTVYGGAGNDILSGGAGDDVFVYKNGDGNDVITDYESGDVIKIASGTLKGAAVVGNDYVFTVGTGKITVKNSAKKYIQVEDASGKVTWYPDTPVNDLTYTKSTGLLTINKGFKSDTFNLEDFEGNFAGKVYTIDASKVTHNISITANKEATKIIATEEDDYVDGGAGKDTILGGDGNDTIYGGAGNDSLSGGAGDDVFVYKNGDGNDVITDYESGDLIKLTSGTASVGITGNDYIITVGKGKITLKDAADKYVQIEDANGKVTWYPDDPTSLLTYTKGGLLTINKKYSKTNFDLDTFESNFAGKVYTINGGAVTHALNIVANAESNSIVGTKQKDTIYGGDGADTIIGGKGDDLLSGGDDSDVFVYNKGDGNDKILDYEAGDSLVINETVKNVEKSGSDVVFKLSSGKTITVVNGASKVISYIENGTESTYPKDVNPVIFSKDGKTATILESYAGSTFNVQTYDSNYATSVINIDASAVTHSLNITANANANNIIATEQDDYIDGSAGADTVKGGDGNDTITGNGGNDSLSGGAGDDVFVYKNGDGNDVITDYESGDIVKITSGTASVGITGNDYIIAVGKGKITLKNAADKYLAIEDASGKITWYPEDPTPYLTYTKGGLLTVNKKYNKTDLDVNAFETNFQGKVYTINASAVAHSLNIIANAESNSIVGTKQNDTIYGGDGADTISGGKGQDILSGGDGADSFVYNSGDGNDKILDYTSEDELIINSAVKNVETSGSNVVFKLSSGNTITVVDAADKLITYVENGVRQKYNDKTVVEYDKAGKTATILPSYVSKTFDVNTYDDNYKDSVETIDASQVKHVLNIVANDNSNVITGTSQGESIWGNEGADTIYGGKGNDILSGGADKDVFVYNKGDGNDRITDYTEEDTLQIKGDKVKNIAVSNSGTDVIFTLTSKSKITLTNAANYNVTYIENGIEKNWPGFVRYNEDHTAATITSGYDQDTYGPTDYSEYTNSLATINASAVQHDMTIQGSGLANMIVGTEESDVIDGGAGKDTIYGGDGDDSLFGGADNDKLYGGDGNDSLWGSKGTDTLYGGEGADTFIYQLGDGKDVIADFEKGDSILLLSGFVKRARQVVGTDDVRLTIGSGSLLIKDGADKIITVTDAEGGKDVVWGED